ncbi:tetratricopeptide repeat protein [Tateyamaria omphalii]|uniref:tetratricopeptide repeat protein n=1 Tax=Tateyamaria omphalii TaxID=299262 RepID=UPI001C9A02B0|nr:tetratricopeptide repeat protein [Tateyamaria omphalii]MBY5932068.1 tetratricopeptide repeat protein [Tateyamaria omphalii]
MGTRTRKLYPVVTALLVTVGNSLPAVAQSTVDEMLEALQSAEPAEATRLTREIEREWAQSGSTALDMLLRRGRDALEEQKPDIAIEHLTALIDHAPDFAEGWHARATAFYMKDLYGPAISDLEKALTLNPDNYNAMFGLGVMFQEFGDNMRAEQAFSRVLDLHPHHENATKALERLKAEGIGRTL